VKDQYFHKQFIEPRNMDRGKLVSKQTWFPLLEALKFMTSTSLLLALNGAMVVVFGFFLYSFPIVPGLLLAAFLVTFSVYGLNKITDKAEDSINRPETLPRASGCFLVISMTSMLIGFLISVLEGSLAFFVLFAPVIIGVIYSIKISKSIPRLKEIVGVKSFAVALSWALTGCLLPYSISEAKIESNIILFVYIFIRVFVGTILCDVLDKKGDLASGIETIPVRLGKEKTKKLLIIINSFEMLLLVYCVATGIFIRFVPALLFGVLYGYLAIWYFFKNSCKRFTAGLMLDGEWFPMVIIAFLNIR
jgi:4-hydroxybenzoate polyprenyltransferase